MDTNAEYHKPVPQMEPEAEPFWSYLRRHELRIQRCGRCAAFFFPPSTHCPRCLGDDVEWTKIGGQGTVWSRATVHRAYLPAYEAELPYNVSIVELDEGPKLWTNVVGCAPEAVEIGLRVEVVFDDVTPGLTLARFRPAAARVS